MGVAQVLADNPKEVASYLSGKETVFQWMMGQVARLTKGKADPQVARQLLQDYLNRLKEPGTGQPPLTPREKEILRLLAEGYSTKEIAERLVISPSTVHSHRTNLMQKLNLSTRHELIRYAHERGLIRAPLWGPTMNEMLQAKIEEQVRRKTAELERVHKTLLASEKMASVGKLAATVAHEINNPLAGILTFARLVEREIEGGPPTAASLESMKRSMNRFFRLRATRWRITSVSEVETNSCPSSCSSAPSSRYTGSSASPAPPAARRSAMRINPRTSCRSAPSARASSSAAALEHTHQHPPLGQCPGSEWAC